MKASAGRLRLAARRLAAGAWLGLVWLAFSPGAAASAAEWTSPEYGFRLRLPEGNDWQQISPGFSPSPEFALEDAPSGRRFMVFVFGREYSEREWDLSAITNLQWTIRKTFNSDNPAGSRFTFEGLPAYECSAELIKHEVSGLIRVTAVLTEKYSYWIIREKAPGDPAADADLEALRQSFRFTAKPNPPPPPPQTPAWVKWTTGGAIAAALAVIVFLLVRSLRGSGKKKPRRMRYTYSEKAQELAGRPAAGGEGGNDVRRPIPSPGHGPAELEQAMKSAAQGAGRLGIPAIVDSLLSPTQASEPSASGTRPDATPLKLDRRFLKDKPKDQPGEEGNPGEGRQ
jgi:hypothetical protein